MEHPVEVIVSNCDNQDWIIRVVNFLTALRHVLTMHICSLIYLHHPGLDLARVCEEVKGLLCSSSG